MKAWCWLLVALAGISFAEVPKAQAQDIDLQALVRETQITRQASQGLDLVWWIPSDYWVESLRKSALTPKQQQDLVAAVDDYILVAALQGTIGTLGVMSSISKEELEKETTLVIGKTSLSPIPEGDLSPGARNFIQMMKPLLANMMGAMGQGMHFIAFKGKDAEGKHLVDPKAKGRIVVKMGAKEFPFRLPLGSLLPPKIDTDSGEHFPGNYDYNPFTGKKLIASK